jgi:hypothetical protein
LKLLGIDFHQVGRKVGNTRIRNGRVSIISFDKLDVSKPQNSRQDLENRILFTIRKTDNLHSTLKLVKAKQDRLKLTIVSWKSLTSSIDLTS